MITLREAHIKAKSVQAKRGLTRLVDCRDYGEFWGFCFVPESHTPDGIADITVNKKTGEIGYFNVIMDFDLAEKSVPIPVEQFDEYRIAV